ncbi:hypothetical protein K8F61_09635 [Microbacterium resistens]|uniref:Uncharacterized protein n=1 Tax=Microbacterium resistens TaxID=156977 RepID=A0ABY3RMD9_9MICO|nr:hypothetical protein [Microbacterium resistens]UGS24973.1 hypothetical protein K8F61_09635 [Microbacterium resistens]
MINIDQTEVRELQQEAHRMLCDIETGNGTPGERWRSEEPDSSVIEGTLRTLAAIGLGLRQLELESVTEARVQGLSWEEIGAAMFRSPDSLRATYGADRT